MCTPHNVMEVFPRNEADRTRACTAIEFIGLSVGGKNIVQEFDQVRMRH
jgi:hypothetical protein